MFTIRQATVEDWPQIWEFIARNFGSAAAFKGRARWDWQFRSAPFAAEENGEVPVWIALHGDTVVGQIGLQPGRLRLGDELLPVGWIVDVMVDGAHRGSGLGHRLTEAIVASGRTALTLTMAPATRRMMERVGCQTLPPVQQMLRVRRLSGATVATVLARIARNRPRWRRPVFAFNRTRVGPNMLGRASQLLPKRRRELIFDGAHAALANHSEFDRQTIQRLANELSSKVGALCERSPEFYEWRCRQVPDLKYHFAQGQDAFVIWRLPMTIELPIGTIVDVLCDPDNPAAMYAAVAHAVNAMEASCEAITVGASDSRFLDVFGKFGFITVKRHYPTVVSRDRALMDRIAAQAGSWHFSKIDHDWDQVHPATE